MPSLRLILGDQLSKPLSSLEDWEEGDLILMAEVRTEATYVQHHKQKIVFIFSAMRHFAEELRESGKDVHYIKYTDEKNPGSLLGAIQQVLEKRDYNRVVVTACGEYRLASDMAGWAAALKMPVEIRDDTRFLATLEEFERWADGRKQLRMEYFYRDMRKKTGLLMAGDKPVGGEWNYDSENRKKLPKDIKPPRRYKPSADHITKDIIDLVNTEFADHFGTTDGFRYGVTRDQALRALDHFIEDCLPNFGDYQDAMASNEDYLFHSLLSAYMNAGLLLPLEVCQAAEEAYHEGHAPLNAVEGFIRQILGWREYVRGLYWLKMPSYKEINFLDAKRALPDFYWTAETDMHCVSEAVRNTRDNAYAHHIQRLMITGNFALLAGILPDEVNEWYLAVYIDAFEWVELPNTHGMAIFADGGIMASKPYAASGAYINRMSNYCGSCKYKVSKKLGEGACPFNYLYWDFLIRNEDKLRGNARMGMMYRNLDRKEEAEVKEIQKQSKAFLDKIG